MKREIADNLCRRSFTSRYQDLKSEINFIWRFTTAEMTNPVDHPNSMTLTREFILLSMCLSVNWRDLLPDTETFNKNDPDFLL